MDAFSRGNFVLLHLIFHEHFRSNDFQFFIADIQRQLSQHKIVKISTQGQH